MSIALRRPPSPPAGSGQRALAGHPWLGGIARHAAKGALGNTANLNEPRCYAPVLGRLHHEQGP